MPGNIWTSAGDIPNDALINANIIKNMEDQKKEQEAKKQEERKKPRSIKLKRKPDRTRKEGRRG